MRRSYGAMAVAANSRWEELFATCWKMIGCSKPTAAHADTETAWQRCAACIEVGLNINRQPDRLLSKFLVLFTLKLFLEYLY